jgi:integrase
MDRATQLARAAAVHKAIKDGQLRRPTICSVCQMHAKVVAYHEPGRSILDTRWMCRSCVKKWPQIQAGVAAPNVLTPRRNPYGKVEKPQLADFSERSARHWGDKRRRPRPANTLLEEAVVKGMRRDKTKRVYLAAVWSYVRYAGAKPEGWTPESVESWRAAMKVSPTTANNRLSGLKYASKRYAALGWGPDFAAGSEHLQVVHEKLRRPLDHDVAARLVAAATDGTPRGARDRAILILGFRTGLRREGIVNLDFADIDGRKLKVTLKGGRRHEIPAVDDEVLQALDQWMSWLHAQGVTSGPIFRRVNQNRGRWSVGGKRLVPESINLIVNTRAKQAGVDKAHPHLMRHSFISWMVAEGIDDRRIMAVTGHTNPKSISIYHTDIKAEQDPIGAHLPRLVRK